jgi:hypothetical protein
LVMASTHLFSQCYVVCRSFLWVRDSGCRSFDSPWCFISAKSASSISARFLIHGAHVVCFCTLGAILDPPCPSNFNQHATFCFFMITQKFTVCAMFAFSMNPVWIIVSKPKFWKKCV